MAYRGAGASRWKTCAAPWRHQSEREISAIARASCASFIASLFESAKLLSAAGDVEARALLRLGREELAALFRKAREIHEISRGCIFVTPHIGNWEFLPYVALHVGIPLIIVARPLDNPYLKSSLRLSLEKRSEYHAQDQFHAAVADGAAPGKSVAMLPDRAHEGHHGRLLGRAATATPIPAILAIRQPADRRCGCCRKEDHTSRDLSAIRSGRQRMAARRRRSGGSPKR
jgi:KDO2-lipid IV(A) lauroyltransferase